MELLRRAFLLSGSGLVLASHPAYAILFSGGPISGGGGGGLLTTMTLLNTSGSIQAIGSCTQMFGHPFVKGDLPSGQYPIFKTTGGTVIPYSISSKTKTWSDGSLKHATFRLRLPVTIAANPGSLTVNIYSGGTAPSASSRSTADFAAGSLDLNVFVTGLDAQLTGDWTSNLNQGVTAAFSDNYVFMDGDAGKSWRIRANFRQSSADHGQLEGWWYADSLPDASGNLGGIRYLCRVTQPLYNVSSPAPQYRAFSVMKTRNGTSQIRDLVATLPAPKQFTWTGVGDDRVFTSTASGFLTGVACKLTTTGTLPSPATTTDMYCVSVDTANTFGVSTDFTNVAGNGLVACLHMTSTGTGLHTATMYPMVSAYGTLWTAESNGRYSYIQGGGSVSTDSTILCQMNNTYWCRTQCLPPYALSTYSPTNNPSYSYTLGCNGALNRNLSATGEIEQIGQVPSFYARHVFTQAAIDEQAVRVTGLAGGQLPIALYDTTTRSIPVVNNGPVGGGNYSGMPTKNNGFLWYASNNPSNYSGFTPPSNIFVYSQCWTLTDSSHMPSIAYYPYLLTGEPQYKDMIAEAGNLALYQGYPNSGSATVNGITQGIGFIRNGTINGVTRSGIFFGQDGLRTVAWAIRDVGVTGIANFENSSWNTYFNDILNDNFGGWTDYRAMLAANAAPYVTTNGMWQESVGNVLDAWTNGYFIGALCLVAGIRESTDAKTFINYLIKWPTHVANTFSPWLVGYYRALGRTGGAETSPYISSDASLAMYAWNVAWTPTGNLFTLNSVPTGYTISNGDVFCWNDTGFDGSPPPAGATPAMVGWTPYYVINKSGTGVGATFQLSTTLGGSAIVLADTSTGGLIYGRPLSPPSTGSIDSIIGSGYVANITAVSNWANALGLTVNSTYLSGMTARLTGAAGYAAAFVADPKYAIQSTYL